MGSLAPVTLESCRDLGVMSGFGLFQFMALLVIVAYMLSGGAIAEPSRGGNRKTDEPHFMMPGNSRRTASTLGRDDEEIHDVVAGLSCSSHRRTRNRQTHAKWWAVEGADVVAFAGTSPESVEETRQFKELFAFRGKGYTSIEKMLKPNLPRWWTSVRPIRAITPCPRGIGGWRTRLV